MKTKAFLALMFLCSIVLSGLAQTTPKTPQQAQKPSDEQEDVVRITTNLVQVDAVVTKDGKPVTNLTADDFEIYEDGHKQAITNFAYISNVAKTTAEPETRRPKEFGPPPPLNPNDTHRTVAIVIDDLGMSAESLGLARNQLRKFVAEQVQPNDLVAIVRTGGELGVLQQFTNDKRLLNRAVERLRWNVCSRVGFSVFPSVGLLMGGGGPHLDDSGFQCGYSYYQTIRALRFILDGIAQLPGRKSMVLLSDDLPRESQDFGFTPDTSRFADRFDYSSLLQRLAEKAIRSSVVVYSVDTQGLQYTGPTAADRFYGRAGDITRQINQTMAMRSNMLFTRREGGELLARQTGGFQVYNSNGFKLDKILEDQSGYYLIGYRPSEETFNRKFHHIKAKVKRSGMSLRTRFGFFGVSEEEANKNRISPIEASTNLALASPYRAQDINVEITSFFANDKTAGSVVRSFVYLDAADMTFVPADGRHQTSFELYGVVFGDNGSVVAQTSRGATVTLNQDDYDYAKHYGMGLTFDIPVKKAGSFQVRIAARDRNSSRIGSAGQFVVVPNLNSKKLATSGIVLGTASDPTGTALQNPGARRFASGSNLYFAFMIYNAASEKSAPRDLVMQPKIFRDGKNVYSAPEVPINVANQTDLSRVFASGMIRLPPDLEPGSYYLQIALSESGAKAKNVPVIQWMDFQVEK
jgi:VWFA-related protein